MKKVLLLGDSIKLGYQDYVKKELDGECELYFEETDNGRFAQYTFWQLNQMYKKFGEFDIVHFNCGYWDMTIEPPMREPMNSVSEYVLWLKRIVKFIRNRKGIPIFANNIPISDEGILQSKDIKDVFQYKNSWVLKYNNVAERLMENEKVYVNDLYSVLKDGPLCYKNWDMLHLTEEGYKKLGIEVANVIRKGL